MPGEQSIIRDPGYSWEHIGSAEVTPTLSPALSMLESLPPAAMALKRDCKCMLISNRLDL